MKKLLLPAAALAAVLSAPGAYAQTGSNNNDSQPKHERSDRGDNLNRAQSGAAKPDPTPNTGNMKEDNGPTPQDRDPKTNTNRDNGSMGENNRINNANNNRDNGPDRKIVVRKTVDRSVVLKFRANITAPHRFHIARAYVRPAGWYPHRWAFGERLPRAFFVQDYWLLDFAVYGLMEPWDGYEWVRYGDDALLIDVDTGEVVRVEYDVFY